MATGELRERVRERLVSAEQALDRALAGDAADRRGRRAARRRARRTRSSSGASASPRALADFDAATIATTHGFCQEVLGGLGVAGDVEPDATFVEDVGDLLDDVVDDLYVRRFHGGDVPQFDRAQAMRIARVAVDNPAARVEPERRARRHRRGDAPPARARRPRRARRAASAAWRS